VRYRFEDYEMDTDRHELRRGGAAQPLEPLAFDLLRHLIENRERVVSKDDLRATVWSGRVVSESTLSSWMTTVRAAIGDDGEAQRLIRTVPRRGFRFVGTVSEDAPSPDATAAAATGDSTAILGPHPAEPVVGMSYQEQVELAPAVVDSGGLVPIEPASHAVGPLAAARPAAFPRRAGIAASGLALAAMLASLAFFLWPRPDAGQPVPAKPQAFDPAVVPLIRDEMRRSLASYADRRDAKALAIGAGGAMGIADGAADAETAKQDALRQCTARGNPCRIYAAGSEVVWSKGSLPMPHPRDIRTATLDIPVVPEDIPTLNDGNKQTIARVYLPPRAGHKAMTMLTSGTNWAFGAESRSEAARLAVEWCGEVRQRPCLLIAIDGLLTVQMPKSRPIVRIFMPSTEVEIPAAERERIGAIYAGAEWRALARGGKGSWHPVAGAASEAAAIAGALAACQQADSECRLYAIGNFRVAE
jgi:DNA-binding winged helix-turn-helix (wHTH) protein